MASDANRHQERLTHVDRRDEILAAVRQTVVEDGLSRLSIAAVASRAGGTRSLFYHSFPTKEDALQAVLDLSIILAAVRQTVVEDGLSRLSIAAVASRAGGTRSLFYHSFPTKEDALQAVLDLSIDSCVEQLPAWNESRVSGEIEGSLDSVAHRLKNMIVNRSDAMSQSVVHSGNAALYASFVHRAADRLARYICSSTVVDVHRAADRLARYMCSSTVVDFAAHHEVQIDHLYETFYVLITGLVMFVRTHPDAPEDTIKDIIASTLHIEGYTAKYPERRPER